MLVPSWGPISSQHALDYVQKEIKYRLRCSAALYGSSLRESSSRQSGTSAPVSIVFPESLLHSQWCALVLIPRFGRMGSLTTCNGSRAALIFPAALSEPAESTFTNTAMRLASLHGYPQASRHWWVILAAALRRTPTGWKTCTPG